MNISHQRLRCFLQQPARRVLLYGLTLVGFQWVLPEFAFAQAVQPPIAYGQTVQGVLGSPGDAVLPDGRPIDRYRLVTQAPEQTYAVTAASLQIPVVSSISFVDTAHQQIVRLQQAQVFFPGRRVLYAGRLAQPGTYFINIFSLDPQRPIGSYTLSLTCLDDSSAGIGLDDGGACSRGGVGRNPGPNPGAGPGPRLGDNRGGDDRGGNRRGGDDRGRDDRGGNRRGGDDRGADDLFYYLRGR